MDHDLEMQRYLFDLAGFLVIPGVLGQGELDELNRLIDAQRLPPSSTCVQGQRQHCPPTHMKPPSHHPLPQARVRAY